MKDQGKFIKSLDWINNNCDSLCLIAVFITSIFPWFVAEDSNGVYTFLGGAWAFSSMLYIRWYKKDPNIELKLYSWLGLIILVLGVISLLVLNDQQENFAKVPSSNFFHTYVGAMSGMIIGGFVLGKDSGIFKT